MASRMSTKSCFWASRSSSRAAVSSSGVSARIMRRTIGRRSSARNMCSVRHSPIPSAPKRRALAESGPLSALARTASCPLRILSAQPRIISNSGGRLGRGQLGLAEHDPPGACRRSEIMSPSWTVTPPAVKL